MPDLGGGLGLDYNLLHLEPGGENWQTIGSDLAARVSAALGNLAIDVQHVGSTSVPGLLAKPIIDLAIGLRSLDDLVSVTELLAEDTWIYRGDAGDDGGHLFVLEKEPWVRVAHAHAVVHEDWQWNRYLRFRDFLRSNGEARDAYAEAKAALLDELGAEGNRDAYTDRKTPVVRTLLDDAGWQHPS